MSGARMRMRHVPRARPALRVMPDSSSIERETDPTKIARALGAVAAVATHAAESPFAQVAVLDDVVLNPGTNRIAHGLGVKPLGVIVVPKTAQAAFAWAFDWEQPTNARPDLQAWLEVSGGPCTVRLVFFASASGGL